MTKQQATDIAAQIGAGVEVREHPKCGGGQSTFYYAVCGNDSTAMLSARRLCDKNGHAYCVETSPAWAAGCEWAVY